MSIEQILGWVALSGLTAVIAYVATRVWANRQVVEYKTLTEAVKNTTEELKQLESEVGDASAKLEIINNDTLALQKLKKNADQLNLEVDENRAALESLSHDIVELEKSRDLRSQDVHDLMAKLDLYTRIDEYTENGLFEVPQYLYETSERFAEEIKRLREKQKELIKGKIAIQLASGVVVHPDKSNNKRILEGQIKLMLTAFNIECDSLIGNVKPSNYSRTLERIEKLANNIEKSAATLHCGFNLDYIELKYEECRLQHQYKLKKQEEQEEQKQIREQIREEQRAVKEYERALAQAEKEERLYRQMLQKAREELIKSSEEDRLATELRISDLEAKLAEAEAKEQRAKSMAEQTRRGHVYIISNLGSFGDNVYKIGLTRRLDPLDRVKELGDASVPFRFDIHAIIYAEDAPQLEAALHREFSNYRVNAVNHRKEFFRVDLNAIKDAVARISTADAEFKMTALAEEYHETRRLQGKFEKPEAGKSLNLLEA
jgi:vacuolar-type H+-ATPase subunit I/STV1